MLVNNAGHGLVGALEELTDAEFRGVLETNLFGALAVTRAVLPHMRERGSGHIVQMSSMGGVSANPGHAVYATSKFALEGASEALAGEVAPFGIRVTIVEPGPFRTDYAGRSMRPSTPMDAYAGTPARATRDRFRDQDGVQPNDPAKGAAAIIATVRAAESPLRLPLGKEAVARIRAKLERQLADLDATTDLSLSTAYSWQGSVWARTPARPRRARCRRARSRTRRARAPSVSRWKSRRDVPSAATSMIGAPAPLNTSARSTVRKSIEYRVDLVVFGIEACSWSPENSMIPPTGGTTVRRCSSAGSGSPAPGGRGCPCRR